MSAAAWLLAFGNWRSLICCACLRTSETLMSLPSTVASDVAERMPNCDPEKLGTRYHAMAIQITTRMAPRKYFLKVWDVCMNRIIVLETPELCGDFDYRTRAKKLLQPPSYSIPACRELIPGCRGCPISARRWQKWGFFSELQRISHIQPITSLSGTCTSIQTARSPIQIACCTSACNPHATGHLEMPSHGTDTCPSP